MSSSVHFSLIVKSWLKRSSGSSGSSSTRRRLMLSGREVRSTRATLWIIEKDVSTTSGLEGSCLFISIIIKKVLRFFFLLLHFVRWTELQTWKVFKKKTTWKSICSFFFFFFIMYSSDFKSAYKKSERWPLTDPVLCSCPLGHSAAKPPENPSGWTWQRSAAASVQCPDTLYPRGAHRKPCLQTWWGYSQSCVLVFVRDLRKTLVFSVGRCICVPFSVKRFP